MEIRLGLTTYNSMRQPISHFVLMLLLFLICTATQAQTTVPPDFRPVVRDALQRGEKRITIAPGTYRLAPEAAQNVIWTLQNLRDVEIVADGVTLICTNLTRALQIQNCQNLTLQGLTIDYDPLPFTQGTVIAAAPDKSWIDIQIHAGYPRQPYGRIDIVDPQTRFRKHGMPFLWGTTAAMSAPDVVRITLPNIANAAAIGDLASLSTGPDRAHGGIDHALEINNCSATTLRDVTLHSAPGMGILEANGEGGARYLNCQIVRGPKPVGATQERLLTTSWDAMQSKTIRRGPLVENCTIEDAGDDSWSVQSSDYLVVKSEGKNLVLASRDEWTDGVQNGDRLQLANDAPTATILQSRVVYRDKADLDADVRQKLQDTPPYSLWSVSRKCFAVILQDDSPFQVGDSVFDSDRQGNGFIFRNNRIHSPGRVLIKAGNGLIEGNNLNSCHALVVCPELPVEAAAGMANLTIRNNHISGSGYFCPAPWSSQAGALSIIAGAKNGELRAAGIYRNLVIENNTFEDIQGPNLVLSSARDVSIRGNRFVNAQHSAPNNTGANFHIAPDSVLWLSQAKNVTLENNVVENLGGFARQALVITPSVENVSGQENGVRVKAENTH